MTKTAPSCRCGSWYRDNELERVSGTHWTALARLTREFHPLRVSQVALFACDGSRPFWTASTLGLRLGQSYLPRYADHRPPGPATACLCADGCSPYTSLLKVGSWPAHSRTAFPLGRISDVPSGPIQLSNCRQPAQARRKGGGPVPIGVGVESPLILMCILGRSSFSNKLLSLLIVLVF